LPDRDLPVLEFGSQASWREWLEENHSSSEGVWIKLAKKGSGIETVTYQEAVEVALCYGWIDGLVNKVDASYYKQRFTPRRAKSKWSKINRDKAIALIESGAMRPAGLAEVERAKTDGRWDAAYDPPSKMAVPDDLQRELDRNPVARDFFATLDSQNRYAILYRLHDSKRPETRARHVATFIEMLNERKNVHPTKEET